MHFLSLTGSDVCDEDLKDLATMPNLQELNIGYNSKITKKGLAYLTPLKNLQSISVDKCGVSVRDAIDVLKTMNLRYRPEFPEDITPELEKEMCEIWPQVENKRSH